MTFSALRHRIPTMMKLSGKPEVSEDMKMISIENQGVKCMSIGFLIEKDAPMVMNALQKMTGGVAWGNLDIFVVDIPPGTGDAQLTISQRLQLSASLIDFSDLLIGTLIVSTPQEIALINVRRGDNMFRKVEVHIRISSDLHKHL
ncbi:hypothetical protein GIB67_010840 [Kingdonia uniflora]|uniref:Uncharacterized protein n=1 Tax=Kingdonia uniflora TaxID=39325 RepID=A0A7J7L7Q0_9MAGN|nr:hypothetical protein GIB67_010840 [Kingdonia uniflora]